MCYNLTSFQWSLKIDHQPPQTRSRLFLGYFQYFLVRLTWGHQKFHKVDTSGSFSILYSLTVKQQIFLFFHLNNSNLFQCISKSFPIYMQITMCKIHIKLSRTSSTHVYKNMPPHSNTDENDRYTKNSYLNIHMQAWSLNEVLHVAERLLLKTTVLSICKASENSSQKQVFQAILIYSRKMCQNSEISFHFNC